MWKVGFIILENNLKFKVNDSLARWGRYLGGDCILIRRVASRGVGMGSSYGEGQDACKHSVLFTILSTLTVPTRKYGLSVYIGHDKFDPIWEELNRRQAVVHLHGNQTPSSTPYPHETLGIPIVEVKSKHNSHLKPHSIQLINFTTPHT